MIGHISGDTYKVLMRQGLARGLAGTRSRGKGADGQGEEQPSRPLTGLRKGGDRNPIGMGKGRRANPAPVGQDVGERHHRQERRKDVYGTLRLIVNPNMTDMAMRQTTQSPRALARRGVVSLMIIEGGKA